ncbi:MAG: hypothetical protein O2955_00535 [Planctomycetota bacterium]|nr:hypothetical protein [Planctomycetota bacterium]
MIPLKTRTWGAGLLSLVLIVATGPDIFAQRGGGGGKGGGGGSSRGGGGGSSASRGGGSKSGLSGGSSRSFSGGSSRQPSGNRSASSQPRGGSKSGFSGGSSRSFSGGSSRPPSGNRSASSQPRGGSKSGLSGGSSRSFSGGSSRPPSGNRSASSQPRGGSQFQGQNRSITPRTQSGNIGSSNRGNSSNSVNRISPRGENSGATFRGPSGNKTGNSHRTFSGQSGSKSRSIDDARDNGRDHQFNPSIVNRNGAKNFDFGSGKSRSNEGRGENGFKNGNSGATFRGQSGKQGGNSHRTFSSHSGSNTRNFNANNRDGKNHHFNPSVVNRNNGGNSNFGSRNFNNFEGRGNDSFNRGNYGGHHGHHSHRNNSINVRYGHNHNGGHRSFAFNPRYNSWGNRWYGGGYGNHPRHRGYGYGGPRNNFILSLGYGGFGFGYGTYGYGGYDGFGGNGLYAPYIGYASYYNTGYVQPIVYTQGGGYTYSETAPVDQYASTELAQIDPDSSATPPANADDDLGLQFLNAANDAFNDGEYGQAVRMASHAAIELPESPKVHELLWLSLFAQGDYQNSAIEAHAVVHYKGEPTWETMIAHYKNAEDFTKQLRALEADVKKTTDSPFNSFLLGYMYKVIGHKEHAKAKFEQTLKLVPDDEIASQLFKELGGDPSTVKGVDPAPAKAGPPPAPPTPNPEGASKVESNEQGAAPEEGSLPVIIQQKGN